MFETAQENEKQLCHFVQGQVYHYGYRTLYSVTMNALNTLIMQIYL